MEQNYIGSARITHLGNGSIKTDSVERKGGLLLVSDTEFMQAVRKIAQAVAKGTTYRIEYLDAVFHAKTSVI